MLHWRPLRLCTNQGTRCAVGSVTVTNAAKRVEIPGCVRNLGLTKSDESRGERWGHSIK